jgi:hypothetical protein
MKAFDICTNFWKEKGLDDSYNRWIRIRQMELGIKDSYEQWIITRQMELGTKDPYAQCWIQTCQMESGYDCISYWWCLED